MPLVLAPYYAVLGYGEWIPVINNTLLYIASVVLVYLFCQDVFSERVAALACLLLALWPNYIFQSTMPENELLLVPLLIAILLALLQIRDQCAIFKLLSHIASQSNRQRLLVRSIVPLMISAAAGLSTSRAPRLLQPVEAIKAMCIAIPALIFVLHSILETGVSITLD